MNSRKVLLLLVSTLLLINYMPGLVKSPTDTKIKELLDKLADTGEDQDKVLILKDLCWEYRRVDREKALAYGTQGVELAKKINFPEGLAKCLNNLGIVYSDSGDYLEALNYYHQSLAIKEATGDQKGMMSSYINIGSIYSLQGNYPEALNYYFKCEQKSEELGNKPTLAMALNNIGEIYKEQGDHTKALQYLEKGLKIRKELGDKRSLIRSYVHIGAIYSNLGNYNEARKYYQDSLDLSEELGDENGIADARQNIGIVHYRLGNYKQAEKSYSQCLEIYKKIEDQKNIASTWNNMAAVYFDLGNYTKTSNYAEKCLEIYDRLGDKKGMANVYNTIANTYNKQGNYRLALENLEKAKEIDEKLDDKKGQALTLNNMANAYSYLGDTQQALGYYFKSLGIKEDLGDKVGVVNSYVNIGDMYLKQEDYSKAKEYFTKALDYSEELGDQQDIAWAKHKIGKMHFDKKEYKQAMKYYSESLKIREELDLKSGIAESLSDIGRIFLQQQKYGQALHNFFESLKINQDIGNIPGIANSYLAIGECYSSSGNNQEAVRNLKQALETAKKTETLEFIRDAAEVLHKTYAKQKQFSKAYPILDLFARTNATLGNNENLRTMLRLEKNTELNKLKSEKEREAVIKDAEISQQKLQRLGLIVAFILVSLLALAIFRSFRIKQKANILLAKQQKEIKTQRDQLHELNVTKDKFFSIIGHDLRNPFSALIGLTKVLVAEFENFSTDQVKELLDSIYKSSENTYNLLGNLLEWARSQTGKIQWNPENVELNQVARSTVELLSRNAQQKNIRLQNEINGKTFVTADKNMLQTVFRNLISNAIKFTPDGGSITIHSREIDNFIETRVSDTGVGIGEKDIEKLFRIDTHFSRSGTNDEQGTGLGLILCKEFLLKNGGNIWVESEVGKGSSFIFTLPVSVPPPGGNPDI